MEGSLLVQSLYSSVMIIMIKVVAAMGILIDDMLSGYAAVCLVICKRGFI